MPRSSPRRGLQIMRTQSTRKAGGTLTSPEMYIRLTSLEMERARRVMERDRLLERIRLLDERIVKIADEQYEMRHRIGMGDAQQRTSDSPHLRSSPAAESSESQRGLTY